MAERGRPPTITADAKTLDLIESLAGIQCTQAEAAAVLKIPRQTFASFMEAHPEARARWDEGLDGGKASLRRTQFTLAKKNATMAIWLGKQYLGQRDESRLEHTGPDGNPIPVRIESLSDAQVDQLIKRLAKGGSS